MLPISAEHRQHAGVAAGDEVDVEIELDDSPREVTVPPDFDAALGRNADARRFFDGLAYSHRLRHVLAIEDAKTAETRQMADIDAALPALPTHSIERLDAEPELLALRGPIQEVP